MELTAKKPGCLLLLLMCLIASLGTIALMGIHSATWEFTGIGFSSALLLGIPLSILTSGITTVVFIITRGVLPINKWSSSKTRGILMAPAIIFFLAVLVVAPIANTAKSHFKRQVQISPTNIDNIKATGFNSFLARRWLLQFDANTNDLQKIAVHHNLSKSEPFDLKKMIKNGMFLKRTKLASNIPVVTDGIFYKRRIEKGDATFATYLMYEKQTSRAWFFKMYQN